MIPACAVRVTAVHTRHVWLGLHTMVPSHAGDNVNGSTYGYLYSCSCVKVGETQAPAPGIKSMHKSCTIPAQFIPKYTGYPVVGRDGQMVPSLLLGHCPLLAMHPCSRSTKFRVGFPIKFHQQARSSALVSGSSRREFSGRRRSSTNLRQRPRCWGCGKRRRVMAPAPGAKSRWRTRATR